MNAVQQKKLPIRIALAQLNPCVGHTRHNLQKVKQAIQQAADTQADVLLLPELVLSGYAQDDMVLRPDFLQQMDEALQTLLTIAPELHVVVGLPALRDGVIRNLACVLQGGQVIAEYAKQRLPNYHVFDEQRWFVAGDESLVLNINGCRVGILICEDIWHDQPIDQLKGKADVVLSLNASPYQHHKHAQRLDLLRGHALRTGLSIAYANLVGGQDELVFDGASLLMNADGKVFHQAPWFEEQQVTVAWDYTQTADNGIQYQQHLEAEVYAAIKLGLRDYVHKNGFKKVLLGLSGGIDSGLTLALAVDALGAEQVHAVMMPFHYTSAMSREDAAEQAKLLGVQYDYLPIEPAFNAFESTLQPVFTGYKPDVTEENLQARIRGVLLMSMSNKLGALLLATSNKSESAVGYATLYGDMCGAYSPLKDVYKTLVYRLAEYRNTLSPAIPVRVITRPPSAELAPGQVDQDSLPEYEVLDDILQRFIEQDQTLEDIVQAGFDQQTVHRVVNLVLLNEYKRSQAAPGARITPRAFGKDWRYPITSGWRHNLPLKNLAKKTGY